MMRKSSSIDPRDHTCLVLKYAISSRLLLITLISLWRSFLSPYDTSAFINPGCLSSADANANADTDPQLLFPHVASALEGSIVWDSVYYVRIAQCGYEYEQSYAFFPLLPMCISLLSRTVLAPLIPIIGHKAVLGLSGYVLNNIAFVFTALYIYRLSILILNDSEVALRASILFCFNPASVFYSSIYSESLYAVFSIVGLYNLLGHANNVATLCFALSGAARSNGMLNAGYFCFQAMHQAYDAIILKKHASLALPVVVSGAFRCFCIFIPFVSFQAYGYLNICRRHAEDEMIPWCRARIPLLYDHIQSHYWGVGFLKYFQVKQLPNFLLATPVLSLAICSIVYYVKLSPKVFFSLGLGAFPVNKELFAYIIPPGTNGEPETPGSLEDETSSTLQDAQSLRQRKRFTKGWSPVRNVSLQSGNVSSEGRACLPVLVIPFILHTGFMAATAFLVMHVQVATRFLSASPLLYWFTSHVMMTPSIAKRWGYFIWVYCASYILIGSLLFSNFYPFT
ncbi:GPI mannosyltransferase 2 isoform X1 [Coffea eugenioides]|uniref:GPI mannosyltransferase 2 isoform X1 n=1 Tax=Coffea eugenioides TaxID=49369 RepID=UPI000F60528D|nr:GPI mannosyltransferase 2 isoform X1 [Coffea eugenioides]